ncbi:MAG: DUF5652 family protein [Bacteroidales bacterium]
MRFYLASILFLISISIQLSAQTKSEAVEKSLVFLSNLEAENFEANRPMMADAYADGSFAEKLAGSWNFQTSRLGNFQMLKDIKYDRFRDYDIVYLNCTFEEEDYTIKLVFNSRLEITDVYFIPYPPLIPAGKLNTVWIIVFLILWELAWKALGMWKAAQNRQMVWFLTIFIIPTAGILPIVYTLFVKERTA